MAFGIDDAIAGVSDLLKTGIDKIWPDPQAKATAEATIMQATAAAAIDKLRASQAVMLAEAQSQDKWTSRARPSFLYVVYILLLASLPMGVLYAHSPETASQVISGFHNWLAALPDSIINLFQWVMLGYTGARSAEKIAPHFKK